MSKNQVQVPARANRKHRRAIDRAAFSAFSAEKSGTRPRGHGAVQLQGEVFAAFGGEAIGAGRRYVPASAVGGARYFLGDQTLLRLQFAFEANGVRLYADAWESVTDSEYLRLEPSARQTVALLGLAANSLPGMRDPGQEAILLRTVSEAGQALPAIVLEDVLAREVDNDDLHHALEVLSLRAYRERLGDGVGRELRDAMSQWLRTGARFSSPVAGRVMNAPRRDHGINVLHLELDDGNQVWIPAAPGTVFKNHLQGRDIQPGEELGRSPGLGNAKLADLARPDRRDMWADALVGAAVANLAYVGGGRFVFPPEFDEAATKAAAFDAGRVAFLGVKDWAESGDSVAARSLISPEFPELPATGQDGQEP